MEGSRLSLLGYPAMHRAGVELATCRSQVRRPNHYTTEPPGIMSNVYVRACVNARRRAATCGFLTFVLTNAHDPWRHFVVDNGACAVRFPCQNGGICSDVIDDDYVCRCPALRFTGHRCQRRKNASTTLSVWFLYLLTYGLYSYRQTNGLNGLTGYCKYDIPSVH